MFTGTIEETGILLFIRGDLSGSRLVVGVDRVLENIKRRDDIAVDGVCLTATSLDSGCSLTDVMLETLERSNLGCLPIKSPPNLERAMIAGGRSSGHIVSGHIDGTGATANVVYGGNALWYIIHPAPSILRRIVEKGPIAIDGVSLMVAQIREQDFNVSLIPHIISHIILGALKPDRVVNLENDRVGKYIERFVKIFPPTHGTEREDTKDKGTGS